MKSKILILLAGLAFFCACKGKTGSEIINNGNSSADSVAKDTTAGPKLVKTASMNFKVRNVAQTAQRINSFSASLGGMVVHQQTRAIAEGSHTVSIDRDSVLRITSLSTSADMTVKIPSASLEKFMDSVATMGLYVSSRSFDVTDRTLDYLSARMKLKSREELVKQQHTGKVIIKDPVKVMNLQDDMIDQQIGNRQINDDVKNSTVELSFYESNTLTREVIVNDDPSGFELPFFRRMLMACANGWQLFMDIMVGLANIWFLLLCVAAVWWGIRYYNRRRKIAGVIKN